MPKRVLYIAAYDVADPTRLRHALHTLKDYATGGQKSVFECFLTAAERRELIGRISDVLEDSEDRFALLRVEERTRSRTLGIADPPADRDYFYVG